MPRISEETIRRVAEATDIVELISSYFPLKRAGSSYRALCPFHSEKTPSFHVNPSRQAFHCFGCGAGGTVFKFVMDYEQVPFAEAVRRLAARAGIPILAVTAHARDIDQARAFPFLKNGRLRDLFVAYNVLVPGTEPALPLLDGLLCVDPVRRLTCAQALAHAWLQLST